MASLSNINGLFDVHSTGAILFSNTHGTSGQILRSNGNAAPTWVAASTVIGGPYLPLTGGTLTGATDTATGISFTVGGNLFVTGTSTLTGALSGSTASFQAPGATDSIIAEFRAANGNNAASFRTTTSGYVFEIRSQNSGTLKFDSTSSIFTGKLSASNFILSGSNDNVYYGMYRAGTETREVRLVSYKPTPNSKVQLGFQEANYSFVPALTIKADLNVGIGTDSPSNLFSVSASGTVTTRYTSSDTGAFSLLQFENSGSIVFSADHGNAAGSSNIIFQRDGAQESMRITDYGSLVVNNTPGTNVNWGRIQCGGTITVGNSSGTYNAHGRISGDSTSGLRLIGSKSGTYTTTMGITIAGYNVGINTIAPDYTLDISATTPSLALQTLTNANDPVITLKSSGPITSEGGQIWYKNNIGSLHLSTTYPANASAIVFHTATGTDQGTNNERMRITGDGMVGIGTVSPQQLLHINEAGNTTKPGIQVQGGVFGFTLGKAPQSADYVHLKPLGSGISVLRVMPNNSSSTSYIEAWGTDYEADTNNWNRIYMNVTGSSGNATITTDSSGTGAVGNLYLGTNSNQQTLTILDSGNVGIGTTGPSEKLHVDGNIAINDRIIGNSKNYATSQGWLPGAAGTFSSQIGYYGGNFSINGAAAENSLIWGLSAFGNRALQWQTIGESQSNADGGWNKGMDNLPDGNTHAYMSYVYVKRTSSATTGTFYYGCSQVLNLSGTVNGNPYFHVHNIGSLPQDVWCIAIGIIQAYTDTNTTTPAIVGIYRVDTGVKILGGTSFRSQSGVQTTQSHRTYHYYSTDPAATLAFANPGFYVVDSTEPSLSTLVN